MLRSTIEIAAELLDERASLPDEYDAILALLIRGMGMEREACARDVEEMTPDVSASKSEHSSRLDIAYVRRDRAASTIRTRKIHDR